MWYLSESTLLRNFFPMAERGSLKVRRLSGFCLVLLIFFLPETSSANILYRRARRLRKLTGKDNLRTEAEILAECMTPKDVRDAA